MADVFSVTAAVTPASGLVEGAGTAFTIAITGGDVSTTTSTQTVTATISLKAADGATGKVTAPISMTKTVATPESVVITGCTDDDGRAYMVAANGLSVSAVS